MFSQIIFVLTTIAISLLPGYADPAPISIWIPLPLAEISGARDTAITQAGQPPTSLLERIRKLLGLNPSINAAGTRSDPLRVCLITPVLETLASNDQEGINKQVEIAIVPLPAPTIVVVGLLNEIHISSNRHQNQYRKRASSTKKVSGVTPWPLQPMQPGETLQVRVRPSGAAGDEWATFHFQAASRAELQRAQELQNSLSNDENRWLQAIEQQAASGNVNVASALLFSAEAPRTPALEQLRTSRIQAGCKEDRANPSAGPR